MNCIRSDDGERYIALQFDFENHPEDLLEAYGVLMHLWSGDLDRVKRVIRHKQEIVPIDVPVIDGDRLLVRPWKFIHEVNNMWRARCAVVIEHGEERCQRQECET